MKISLPKLFFILVLISCFIFFIRPIGDPDFWWHIKTGELILKTHTIPNADQYSFTATGTPWVAHEWLSEVILFSTYRVGGIVLTQIIFTFLSLSAFGLSIASTVDKSNLYAMGGSFFLGYLLSTPVLWARPQIFSFLNFGLFFFLLHRFKQSEKIKYIVPIPFLMIFWVNMHGSFILGIGLIGIFLIGNIIEKSILKYKSALKGQRLFSKYALVLGCLLVISFLVSLINPNGSKIILYPFQTINDSSIQSYIQEWASPNFHEPTWIPLVVMFIALIGFSLRSNKTYSITEILLIIVFGYLALSAVKHVMYFAIVSIPVLSDLISEAFPYKKKVQKKTIPTLVMSAISFSIMLIIAAYKIVHLSQKQSSLNEEKLPINAVSYIDKEGIKGKIFNSYNWGGYLIWRLFPENKVYIDGRCDMYGSSFIHRYVDISNAKPGWQNALSDDGIEYVLIEPNTYLAYALKSSSEWTIIYSDHVSTLYKKIKP